MTQTGVELTMAGGIRGGSLAIIASGLMMMVGACAESAEPLEDEPRLEVRNLLAERARALSAGDTEAYLEPVVGDARETEERIAEGSQLVGLDLFNANLVDAEVDRARGEVRNAEIDLIYRYKGVPENNQMRGRRARCHPQRLRFPLPG